MGWGGRAELPGVGVELVDLSNYLKGSFGGVMQFSDRGEGHQGIK